MRSGKTVGRPLFFALLTLMIGGIGFLSFRGESQEISFGKFRSRAEFREAAKLVKDNFSKREVEKILGKPDDIWPSNDSLRYVNMDGGEIWCYGTNGHHTLPTLGSITFKNGRVLLGGPTGPPPPTSVISESELRTALRQIHSFSYIDQLNDGVFHQSDPIRMIRVVNALQPLGTEKALAALVEYTRVVPLWVDDTDFPFWVVPVLFVGKRAGYVFPGNDSTVWPTYPLREMDGLPINFYRGGRMAGLRKLFSEFVDEHGKDWQVRPDKLRPPDDPFELLKTAGAPQVKTDQDRTRLADEIIRAIRNVYRVEPEVWQSGWEPYPKGFELVHQKFLALGGHWDARRGIYVRRDGSFDADQVEDHPTHSFTFPKMGAIGVSFRFGRTAGNQISIDTTCYEHEGKRIPTAVLIGRDAETKREVLSVALNGSHGRDFATIGWTEALKEAPHAPLPGGMCTGSGFELAPGRSVQFELRFDGKTELSPVFRP